MSTPGRILKNHPVTLLQPGDVFAPNGFVSFTVIEPPHERGDGVHVLVRLADGDEAVKIFTESQTLTVTRGAATR